MTFIPPFNVIGALGLLVAFLLIGGVIFVAIMALEAERRRQGR